MLGLFGKILGKVNLQSLTPQPKLIPQFHPSRGFSKGVGAYVGDNRNILDFHRRQLAAKYELKRNLYKAMWRDSYLPTDVREKARYKLSKLPRNSAFNRIRNRCIQTGRARGVYSKLQISRIAFRELALKGELEGVKKASW